MSRINIEIIQAFDSDELLDMIPNNEIKKYLEIDNIPVYDEECFSYEEHTENIHSYHKTYSDKQLAKLLDNIFRNRHMLLIQDVEKLEKFAKENNLI